MNRIYRVGLVTMLFLSLWPASGFAAAAKIFSGTVTSISGSQIIFATASAASYSAEAGSAILQRKNGTSMQFSEIFVGDKIQVTGALWGDNSISAAFIKDTSLYAHSGTFSGKITGISLSNLNFTIQSKTNGAQTIQANNLTSFTVSNKNAGFNDLILGMTVSVKGVWDRTKANVIAAKVDGSFRLINIYFIGALSVKGPTALTVVANGNVIYGLDISKAVIENKSGSPIPLSRLNLGDTLRVWGKHITGMPEVMVSEIKDSSITK